MLKAININLSYLCFLKKKLILFFILQFIKIQKEIKYDIYFKLNNSNLDMLKFINNFVY